MGERHHSRGHNNSNQPPPPTHLLFLGLALGFLLLLLNLLGLGLSLVAHGVEPLLERRLQRKHHHHAEIVGGLFGQQRLALVHLALLHILRVAQPNLRRLVRIARRVCDFQRDGSCGGGGGGGWELVSMRVERIDAHPHPPRTVESLLGGLLGAHADGEAGVRQADKGVRKDGLQRLNLVGLLLCVVCREQGRGRREIAG